MYQISAGKYRHRITIEEPVTATDSDGRRSTTWQTVSLSSDISLDSIPAEVLLGPGRESFEANSKQSSIDARINFRWFEGLTQKMRIVCDGKTYNIDSLEADATGRIEWRCKCTTGLNEGD